MEEFFFFLVYECYFVSELSLGVFKQVDVMKKEDSGLDNIGLELLYFKMLVRISMELGDDEDVRIWGLVVVGLVFSGFDEGLLVVGLNGRLVEIDFFVDELGGCIFKLEFSTNK